MRCKMRWGNDSNLRQFCVVSVKFKANHQWKVYCLESHTWSWSGRSSRRGGPAGSRWPWPPGPGSAWAGCSWLSVSDSSSGYLLLHRPVRMSSTMSSDLEWKSILFSCITSIILSLWEPDPAGRVRWTDVSMTRLSRLSSTHLQPLLTGFVLWVSGVSRNLNRPNWPHPSNWLTDWQLELKLTN